MAHDWFVVRTESRAEYLAAEELGRDGHEVFFPRVKSPTPRKGHSDIPLFPGYLFLRCDPDAQEWPAFRPTHRVLGWVRFAGAVPTVPEEVVAELTRRVEAINQDQGLWRQYAPGEMVRVVSQGLEGIAEVIEEARSPQAHAKVLMRFMGGLVRAQVPWANLQPVEDQSKQVRKVPRRTRGRNRQIRGAEARATASA